MFITALRKLSCPVNPNGLVSYIEETLTAEQFWSLSIFSIADKIKSVLLPLFEPIPM
jgi:hypothetical protein